LRSLDVRSVVQRIQARDVRAIARAITLIENQHPEATLLLEALHPLTGRAMTVGVTGPPGAGKSSLVDHLIASAREAQRTVAVIAVDPASPFSGGAILGDRIRMASHAGDTDVYVRSMSARGHLGGLAIATDGAAMVLDVAGFDVIIVETVGVGQSEIEVVELADTTILVQPPGLGDGVQAVKAGIMEVPAVFVVNKGDLPGAKQTAHDIRQALELGEPTPDGWTTPVLITRSHASQETGVPALWETIQQHRDYLDNGLGLRQQRTRRIARIITQLAQNRFNQALALALDSPEGRAMQDAMFTGRLGPWSAADALVHSVIQNLAKP